MADVSGIKRINRRYKSPPPTPSWPLGVQTCLIPAGALLPLPASLIMQRYAHNLVERWQAARFTLILLKNTLGLQVERVAFAFIISIWKGQP